MSEPVNNNQQQIGDLEEENRRLRQQLRQLQQQLKQQAGSLHDCKETLSAQFLRLTIDNIPQAIFWKDRHSTYLGCNESFARLGGLESPEEIVGKTDEDMPWTREATEFFLECDRRVMESDTPELGIIEPQQQSDGSQHWLETNKVPLHDDEGNVIGIVGTFIDVTQRQQAQLELQQLNEELEARFEKISQKLQGTESRLQRFAANLPGVIFQFHLNPDGTQSFPYVSPRSRDIYEVEPENFSQVFELVHPEDIDRFRAAIQESALTLNRFDCEYRIITPSGILKWLQAISQPEPRENGEIIWDGIIIDISDRKAAEQALAESEAFNRYLFEELPIGLLLCRLDGQLIQANSACANIIGRTIPETLELTYWQITPEKYADCEAQQLESLQTTGRYGPYEKEYIHKDGHLVPVVLSGLIVERNGESLIWSSVADISDRKAAEERLRQKEAQYRQIFETIIDGLGIVNLEQGQLVEVNPAYHQMHGYSYSEFLALPYTDIVHPDSHALLAQFIADVGDGRVFTCHAQNLHRNGQIIDIEVKAIPFPYQGKPHGLVLVRDISEKVRLESDRQRQEQALRSIVEGTAAQTGEAFFRACVKSLAVALEVPYVLVVEMDRHLADKAIATVIASWMDSDFGENFQYDLSGTPCHNVFENSGICRYADSVQALFPEDPYLAPLNAESYVGVPLMNSRGMVIGLIAVLHTEPMIEELERQGSILEIFAARVGAEIERMRSDKALREKDRILQLTLQAGKMGCWTWNRTTNEVIWSDGVAEIVGLGANSFGGTFEEYLSLVHPEDIEAFQQQIEQALATEGEYNSEHRLVLPDGSIEWMRGRGEIWRDEKGKAIGLLGSVLNNTPAKMAEIALVESVEQIHKQALQDQLRGSIANQIRNSLDLDRILETTVREIEHFLEVDRCYFAWYVRDGGEGYWQVIAEEHHPDLPSLMGQHPETNLGALSEVLLRQQVFRVDDVTSLKEIALGENPIALVGHQSMLLLPVRAESGKFGAIACLHDRSVRPWRDEEVEFLEAIVAQVAIAINQADLLAQSQSRAQELEKLLVKFQRTQTQLIQSEKMSSLGQMVAGVAHEINNPVGFIHGNITHAREYMEDLLSLLELYQHHYPQPHPDICDEIEAIDLDFLKEDLQKLFQSMSVGTSRIREIVKSLRTFSRLDEAALKNVDLHDGIDSTLMILQTRLRAHNWRPEIKVIKEYGDLPRVQCYAGQLNQVFMNILSNAIDALEDRDRDRTSAQMKENKSQIHIQTVKKANNILIHISDNGNGMTEETRNKLFDPFFTTKAVGKGTGLGLSISYQIVTEQHQGKLYCTSQPGKTTFTIQIPAIAEYIDD